MYSHFISDKGNKIVILCIIIYSIGAIDGTHIRIDRPEVDSYSYINRKQYHSIQLQDFVNKNKNILDVFIGYSDSVNNARVFKESALFESLQVLCSGKIRF